jgi:hypothetical protein
VDTEPQTVNISKCKTKKSIIERVVQVWLKLCSVLGHPKHTVERLKLNATVDNVQTLSDETLIVDSYQGWAVFVLSADNTR